MIAFQGEHGAYSEEAIRQHYGSTVDTLPCESFEDIFQAVLTHKADCGILPVENSLAGTVAHSYELLLEHDLRVQAEVVLRVHHMLLAPKGVELSDIKRVQSHPQALAQCEGFLRRRGWEPVLAYDTAGSARDLAANPVPGTAAIASALAGELYGLEILERGIEDQNVNSTRFFIVGHDDTEYDASVPQKTSVVFAVGHQPASLYHCLGVFAEHEINLTKLESRPMRSRAWQYWFFMDFEGHINEPRCEQAMAGLLTRASMVKFLGSYPAAPLLAENGHMPPEQE
jgi:prephenate dehydratase